MNEEVAVLDAGAGEALEEDEVSWGDPLHPFGGLHGGFEAPAGEGFGAAIVHPAIGVVVAAGAHGGEHHPFVVAEEVDGGDARDGGSGGEECDAAGGVGATVDEVAQVHEHGRGGGTVVEVGTHAGMHLLELRSRCPCTSPIT